MPRLSTALFPSATVSSHSNGATADAALDAATSEGACEVEAGAEPPAREMAPGTSCCPSLSSPSCYFAVGAWARGTQPLGTEPGGMS